MDVVVLVPDPPVDVEVEVDDELEFTLTVTEVPLPDDTRLVVLEESPWFNKRPSSVPKTRQIGSKDRNIGVQSI